MDAVCCIAINVTGDTAVIRLLTAVLAFAVVLELAVVVAGDPVPVPAATQHPAPGPQGCAPALDDPTVWLA